MPSPAQEVPAETTASAAPSSSGGPLRFSLRSLIIGVTITAVACMAFRYANEIWASAFSTLLLGAVLAAVISAIYGDLNQRPWRIGFAITAVVLGLVCWIFPPRDNPYGGVYQGMHPEPILFRLATRWSYQAVRGKDQQDMSPNPEKNATSGNTGYYDPWTLTYSVPTSPQTLPSSTETVPSGPTLADVHPVADSLWIFAIAISGGIFATWVDQKRRRASSA